MPAMRTCRPRPVEAFRRKLTRCSGISALEVLIAVLIIGILSGVAVPSFMYALAVQRSRHAAERIVSDLSLARREATMSSAARIVQFDVAGDSYTLLDVAHLDRPQDVYSLQLGGDPYQSDLVSADLGGDAELVFDGYGQADSGGTIVVRSGTIEATVVIDAATGLASVQ